MHINLLCSDRHLPQDIWAKSNEGKWGGVDRGALILLEHQIIPFSQWETLIQSVKKNANF